MRNRHFLSYHNSLEHKKRLEDNIARGRERSVIGDQTYTLWDDRELNRRLEELKASLPEKRHLMLLEMGSNRIKNHINISLRNITRTAIGNEQAIVALTQLSYLINRLANCTLYILNIPAINYAKKMLEKLENSTGPNASSTRLTHDLNDIFKHLKKYDNTSATKFNNQFIDIKRQTTGYTKRPHDLFDSITPAPTKSALIAGSLFATVAVAVTVAVVAKNSNISLPSLPSFR